MDTFILLAYLLSLRLLLLVIDRVSQSGTGTFALVVFLLFIAFSVPLPLPLPLPLVLVKQGVVVSNVPNVILSVGTILYFSIVVLRMLDRWRR